MTNRPRTQFRTLPMNKIVETLTQHAPYLSKNSDNILCLRCHDPHPHGEFPSVEAWASHVATELRKAGLLK
jgi:hypothetical protein